MVFLSTTLRQYPAFQSLVTVDTSESPSLLNVTVVGRMEDGGGGGGVTTPSDILRSVGRPDPLAQ